MRVKRMTRQLSWIPFALLLLACGGSGENKGKDKDNPLPSVAPSITQQPQDQTVTAGQTAIFTVAVTGTAPLTYQWKKGGTPINGAPSSNTYTTPAITVDDTASSFTVTVSNSVDSVTSNAATLTVTPANTTDPGATPAKALLTGMTPANYVLPSGWELVRKQDFESGSLPSDEMGFGSITTTSPHTGTRSLQGRVWKDDCATGWKLGQGVATTGELYLSWYEFMEGQGRLNDEMFLLSIRKNWPGDKFQTERWQWLNNLSDWDKAFNILDGNLVFFCEGTQPGTSGSVCYYDKGVWRSVGFGKWQQWEVYWRTNTPGQADGVTQIYLDGVKITEVTNTAYSGTLNMAGPSISLGGPTYTKIIWGPYPKPSLVCAHTVQDIKYSIDRPQDFSLPCLCPEQAPPNGYVPIFHRFVDDVIILQRADTTKPDTIAPIPANLAGAATYSGLAPLPGEAP